MNGYLRQSTASQTRTIGPFIDATDFVTPEDALTIANTDIRVKKNGANDVAKNSGGATADVNGMYAVTWDATDTDTLGELHYSVVVAGALIVWGTYIVLPAIVYDALFLGTEWLPVNAFAPDFDVTGGTLTVKKPDGTTTVTTKTVGSDAAAEPIISAAD